MLLATSQPLVGVFVLHTTQCKDRIKSECVSGKGKKKQDCQACFLKDDKPTHLINALISHCGLYKVPPQSTPTVAIIF